jgi:hypothetical protein
MGAFAYAAAAKLLLPKLLRLKENEAARDTPSSARAGTSDPVTPP